MHAVIDSVVNVLALFGAAFLMGAGAGLGWFFARSLFDEKG